MNKFFNLNHPILSCISSLFIITLFLAQITYIPTIKLDIIHHNVRHWGKYKNALSNYYPKHNADILSLNSHGLDINKRQFLKIFTYSNITTGTGIQQVRHYLPKHSLNTQTSKQTMTQTPFMQLYTQTLAKL